MSMQNTKARGGKRGALANGQHPGGVDRVMPCSDIAEKALLCCLLLAPKEVGAMCAEHGIETGVFYLPAHAVVFAELVAMRAEGRPIDVVTLTQRLIDSGKIVEAGGPDFVSGLYLYLPTATNAANYIETLCEKHSLRRAIVLAHSMTERAYLGENVSEFLTEARDGIAEIARGTDRPALRLKSLLDERRFDIAKPPPEAFPLFLMAGSVIATPGNLVGIQAQVKSGKSALVGAMLAATMSPVGDTLGFSANNANGLAVIHFDTEQSPADHHAGILTSLRRAGRSDKPEWLRSYRLADVPTAQRRNAIVVELERAAAAHRGVHSVFLDGVADFAIDPNDPAEAFGLIEELHQLAIRFSTSIVALIHENPPTRNSDAGKTRGHLGSQLERKAESNLRLAKDGEVVTVFSERSRHAHVPKERGPRFQWSDDQRMHVTVETERAEKESANRASAQEFAEKVFEDSLVGLCQSEAIDRIMKLSRGSWEGARTKFKRMSKSGAIKKKGDKWFSA